MKKLFLSLILLIFCLPTFLHGAVIVSTGSVTRANMRLSIVAGTAFVDFTSASTLTPYLNRKVVITDSAGKKLTGYIKAAGTGETLGSEEQPNGTFETGTGWWGAWQSTLTNPSGGQSGNRLVITLDAGATDGGADAYNLSVMSGLYKLTGYSKEGSCQSAAIMILQTGTGVGSGWHNDAADWTLKTSYVTLKSSGDAYPFLGADHTELCTWSFDTISTKQVLTPSSTGSTIVSTRGGSTYNWEFEDSGFNRNDSSGYTYEIYEYVGLIPTSPTDPLRTPYNWLKVKQ